MKKLIEEIKPVYYIIAGVVLILVITFSLSKCSSGKTEAVLSDNSLQIAKQKAIDSTKTAMLNELIQKEDSISLAHKLEISELKKESAYYLSKASKAGKSAEYYRHKADSLATFDKGKCGEIIEAFRQSNDTLRGENGNLKDACTKLEQEAQEWCLLYESSEKKLQYKDSIILVKQTTINTQSETITDYEKRLKKSQNKFWRRVENLGSFALGLVIGKL